MKNIILLLIIVAIFLLFFGKARWSVKGNMGAFLEMIRRAEGTNGVLGYRMLYGGRPFLSYKDHPYLTGEWKGAVLNPTTCANAGLGPGCITTAAGAYQLISTTWSNLKKSLNLPDFSPDSQDAAAIQIIKDQGAYDDVMSGRFDTAVSKVSNVWASLPGNTYKQNPKPIALLRQYYIDAGGTIA